MKFPTPSKDAERYLASVLPDDPRVKVRPMFGNRAAFVNGNMFAGLFGEDLFVKLREEDRVELMEHEGSSAFEPMEGRPMREYVVVPRAWRDQPEKTRRWVERSIGWVADLPKK